MIIVISIISILSIAAIPSFTSNDKYKLDLAANEIVAAIRYAQNQSLLSGTSHGVYISESDERIRIYRLPSLIPIYDVYHPLEKTLYDIQIKSMSSISGVDLTSVLFNFGGSFSSLNFLGFSSKGIPKFSFLGTDYMLVDGTITLAYAGEQRMISVAPMTGRVTVQ
jgi:type II secretory pathway pseudopilin PulG